MIFNFDDITNEFLKIITKNTLNQKIRVFFVGGIARDNILKINSSDIDLLLEGNAIEFAKSLPSFVEIKSIHSDFCTVKLEYKGINVDLASTRIEKYPHSNCLPVVQEIGVPIEKDVLRRDFSINSLYCEISLINNQLNYKLIDLVDGVSDIQNKNLRVLHNNSYIDDNTRIIRGLGFKYRFGFDFSSYDKELIKNAMFNIDYQNSTFDRTLEVFKKVLLNKNSFSIFKEIIENKYYKILKNIELNVDFSKIENIISLFEFNSFELMKFFILILLDDGIENIEVKFYSQLKNIFSKFENSNLAYYFYKTNDENVLKFLEIKEIKTFVSGDDLILLGYKQGKIIGEILDSLFEEKVKNLSKFSSKESEINWILNSFPKN